MFNTNITIWGCAEHPGLGTVVTSASWRRRLWSPSRQSKGEGASETDDTGFGGDAGDALGGWRRGLCRSELRPLPGEVRVQAGGALRGHFGGRRYLRLALR